MNDVHEALRAGLPVYATPDAARTFDDHLENVEAMGIKVVAEDEKLIEPLLARARWSLIRRETRKEQQRGWVSGTCISARRRRPAEDNDARHRRTRCWG